MKPALALAAVLLLAGCGILGIGSQGRLPEVWVIPVLRMRFEGELTPADDRVRRIREFLMDMNARIYDVSDGQIRVAKFELHNGSQIPETAPGVGTIREVSSNEGLGVIGSPAAPGPYRFSLPESLMERSYCIGVAVHEWLHAWIGLYDEYKKTGGSSCCPKDWVKRMETDSCIMDNSWRTELCRPGCHNVETLQQEVRGMSCYEWLRKALYDAGKGLLTIPDGYCRGPDDPPVPLFEIRF